MQQTSKEIKLNKPVIAFSIGEITGIGPEVLIKSLERKDMANLLTAVIFCNSTVFKCVRAKMKSNLQYHVITDIKQMRADKVNIFSFTKDSFNFTLGKPSLESGQLALESLSAAADFVENGNAVALVTSPLDKSNVEKHQKYFKGHTGYLAKKWKSKALMILVSEQLRVALLSDHVPLSKVPELVEEETIKSKIKQLHNSLVEDFSIRKPKIAVLGLNPHAGDGALIGEEEDRIIAPVIRSFTDEGRILVFGPYPADSFFSPDNISNFDAVLAMYHDQGLVGFKTLAFHEGVNFTASLPFIRTSPDHGTAYGIASELKADATSMIKAIYTAVDLYEARNQNRELKVNSLPYLKNN